MARVDSILCQVYQELSSYLLSTVEAVCGEEAAKLLGNLPGSSGTHLHDFVRLYADDLWPALKKDYEGDCLFLCLRTTSSTGSGSICT